MRNEIFKKIEQNRKRFIMELKNREVSSSIEQEDTSGIRFHKTNGYIKVKSGKSLKIVSGMIHKQNFSVYSQRGISLFKKAGHLIKRGWNNIQKTTTPLFISINRRVTSTTDKMTESFYNYSSRFFEDRYEYVEISDKSGVKSIAVSPDVSVIQENEILDSATLFFNRLWEKMSKTGFVRGIILFLEIDDEISGNKLQYRPVLEDKTIEAGRSTVQKFVNVFSIGYKKVVKTTNRMKRSMKKIYRYITELSVNNFKPIVKKIKAKSKQITFPAINRFIWYLITINRPVNRDK